jgi:hypothetical protein
MPQNALKMLFIAALAPHVLAILVDTTQVELVLYNKTVGRESAVNRALAGIAYSG